MGLAAGDLLEPQLRCFGVLGQIDGGDGVAQPLAVGRDGGCAETLHVHHVFEGHGALCCLGGGEGGGEEEGGEDGRRMSFPDGGGSCSPRSQKRDLGHPDIESGAKEKCTTARWLLAVSHELRSGGSGDVLSHPCIARMGHPHHAGTCKKSTADPSAAPDILDSDDGFDPKLELRGLEFEEDAGAAGFEVHGGGFAVVFAEDAGAHAEAEAGGFVAGGLGDEGIEGAGWHRKF